MKETHDFIEWWSSFRTDLKSEKCGSLSKMKCAAAAWDFQQAKINRLISDHHRIREIAELAAINEILSSIGIDSHSE